MVEEDDEAEGTPLKPSSSSAAIEKSGAKRATKAKALIDLPDEKPGECAGAHERNIFGGICGPDGSVAGQISSNDGHTSD